MGQVDLLIGNQIPNGQSQSSLSMTQNMIGSRIVAVAELPDQRSVIMATRIALARTLPEDIHKLDMKIMIEAILEMPKDLQTKFRQTLKEQMQAAGLSMLEML